MYFCFIYLFVLNFKAYLTLDPFSAPRALPQELSGQPVMEEAGTSMALKYGCSLNPDSFQASRKHNAAL